MCGIVGILGKGPVAGDLIEALKRLEYRGYDSAGVATLEDGRIVRVRASGINRRHPDVHRHRHRRRRRHRPYALGDAWQADREQRPSARQRKSRRRA